MVRNKRKIKKDMKKYAKKVEGVKALRAYGKALKLKKRNWL